MRHVLSRRIAIVYPVSRHDLKGSRPFVEGNEINDVNKLTSHMHSGHQLNQNDRELKLEYIIDRNR